MVLPARQAAAVTVPQTLTATSTDFAAGRFGLTGLTQSGGVQLIPLGQLKRWQTPSKDLCYPVGDMASASFGPYLYSIGGSTTTPTTPTSTISINTICRTKVLNTDADFEEWQSLQSENLPDIRTGLAAVAVPRPGNPSLGYLYVFGGRKDINSSQSTLIWRAGINADGSLTPWVASNLTLPNKREQLTATAFTATAAEGGKTFIYVIGGFSIPFQNTLAYNDVLRYEVAADGSLISTPPQPRLPIAATDFEQDATGCVESALGLKQADSITFDIATPSTPSGTQRFLMVLGGMLQIGIASAGPGCTAQAQPSNRVFMAKVNPQNGDLTWEPDDYTMPEGIVDTRVIAANGRIFAVGGILGQDQNTTTNIAYSSSVNIVTLKMPSYGVAPSSNFMASPTALNPDQRRAAHGMEIVSIDGRPMAFLFGGTNLDGTYRRDVMYGYVGRPEDFDESAGGFSTPGLYQSPVYQLRAEGRLTQMKWSASISSTLPITTDIEMQYRLATTSDGLTTAQWKTMDASPGTGHFSVLGDNVATTTDPATGRFIQYRAFLTTSMPSNRTATPVLRGPVSIRYVIEGNPSLYVDSTSNIPDVTSSTITTPHIKIVNGLPPGWIGPGTILDADIEGPGTFFVDLYVFPPGQTGVAPVPNAAGEYPQNSAAFAEIGKQTMIIDKNYEIPASAWKQTCSAAPNCPPANWKVIFNRAGTWTAYIVVDSMNNVTEADTPNTVWELDNVRQITVNSTITGRSIYMPRTAKGTVAP
jgi:hypothetical protein